MSYLTSEQVARMIHGVTSVIDRPDGSVVEHWDDLPDSSKQYAIKAVERIMSNPTLNAEEAHDLWMELKMEAGWVYGETCCPINKTHPSLIPFHALPPLEILKDR